ncbi:MAG: hypothetical protein KHX46_08085 [Clostridiales bacterium]|nr:hypothetical protein [Clostridiales bacterium]
MACRRQVADRKKSSQAALATAAGDGLRKQALAPRSKPAATKEHSRFWEPQEDQTPACVSEGVPLPKSDFSLPDFRQKDAADWLAAKPRADINDGGMPL